MLLFFFLFGFEPLWLFYIPKVQLMQIKLIIYKTLSFPPKCKLY